MKDIVEEFFEYYSQGLLIKAIQCFLSTPEISYDHLQSSHPYLRQMANFVDAAVFGRTIEARYQILILLNLMQSNQQLVKDLPFIHLLNAEERLLFVLLSEETMHFLDNQEPHAFDPFLAAEREVLPLNFFEVDKLLKTIPEVHQELVKFHLLMAMGWQKFKQFKPLYVPQIPRKFLEAHPWYPLQFALELPSLQGIPEESVPVIFFEPTSKDLSFFLQTLSEKPALFVFRTTSLFFQMLQFPSFVESLCEPSHLIYILEYYPHQQWAVQDIEKISNKKLHPVIFSSHTTVKAFIPSLMEALEACLAQTKEDFIVDSPLGNWIYEVAKRLIFSLEQRLLGMSRAPALHMKFGQLKWYDRHKGLPPVDKSLGPETIDYMAIILSNLKEKRVIRTRSKKEKIKIAHVVPQIVYGGHAPSRLLENLVMHHNSLQFETIVCATEILAEHFFEYPYNFYTSESSERRGGVLIRRFKDIGVPTLMNTQHTTYINNAYQLSQQLKDMQVDVVIFHGPDVVNMLAAQMVDVPLRVLFEHGSQASYPGFDVVIVSSDSALELYQEHYKKIQTLAVALPFAVDVRKGWISEPFKRESLGLPEESLVMTTISTKLDMRLTNEMCHTIAEILQRVPQAVYAPIGTLSQTQRVKEIFFQYGVADRLYPLGTLTNPSQYARSMHLYLNEFPFGSCLAILDAMAAGCPVVTMYDASGPQQARYGGHFIGIDRSIKSGDRQEYIDLACRLLTNKSLYEEWSLHSILQYEKFADVKGYVQAFEEIILDNYFN